MANTDASLSAAVAYIADAGKKNSTEQGPDNVRLTLTDAAWSTAGSLGREARFIGGSISAAAKDSLTPNTAERAAIALAAGAAFAAVQSRCAIPGLVNRAAAYVALGNFIANGNWRETAGAAADAWSSGANLKGDIEIGRHTVGRALVDNTILAGGIFLGGRLGRAILADLKPFAKGQPTAGLWKEKVAAQNAPAPDVPNLSRPAEGDSFRYFAQSRTGENPRLYRWPDNGQPLKGQSLESVERFDPERSWRPNHRQELMREGAKGWFSESEDQISHRTAARLIEQILKAKLESGL